jgi:hypothetical protein
VTAVTPGTRTNFETRTDISGSVPKSPFGSQDGPEPHTLFSQPG